MSSVSVVALDRGCLDSGKPTNGSNLAQAVLLIVIASGIWGLALQQVLPTIMLDQVPAEKILFGAKKCAECHQYEDAVGKPVAVLDRWDPANPVRTTSTNVPVVWWTSPPSPTPPTVG